MPGWLLALRLAGMGWYVAFCIVLGLVGGLWLDDKADTKVLFTLLGTILGVVVAFYGIYRMVVPLMRDTGPGRKKDQGSNS